MIKRMTALVTAGTLAMAVLPAQASGDDTAVIQDSSSTTVVTGNGNRTVQTTDQSVYQQRQGRDSGNTGIVQTVDQYSDIYGRNNDTQMNTIQTIEQRSRTHSHPRSH